MPSTSKKFNSVHAVRLSLLLTLSLTVGIGTAVYVPASTPVTADFGQAAAISILDFSGDSDQGPEAGSATTSSLNSPQIVQTTEAPVLTTTQGS